MSITTPMRALLLLACWTVMVASAAAAAGAPSLVWHVETDDGKVVDSREPDRPVNPASVVKLATTLRALETLGANHRFVTTFGLTGEHASPPEKRASLVIEGGADPDFHFENAMLVARALEEAGITRLRGDLFVGEKFWIGWERGTAGRETNPVKRRQDMGRRLLEAWSPKSWNQEQRASWAEMAQRRGWDAARPPAIQVEGDIHTSVPPAWHPVVVHRSQPLVVALRRFNVFSNNDIERLDPSIGPPSELSDFLERRFGAAAEATSFATSSGLNRNRMTPRFIVRVLRDLREWLRAHGLVPADIMPVMGCGESTLPHLFPRLRDSGEANGMAGKTGTLTLQDGGVSALAGYLPAGPGLVFFVAAPNAGSDLRDSRAAQEDWIRRVLVPRGDLAPVGCKEPVPTSDGFAEISRPSAAKASAAPGGSR